MTTIREKSEAALAEALEAEVTRVARDLTEKWPPAYPDFGAEAEHVLAASPTLARRLDLGTAWDEAVAALPEGYDGPMLWPAPLGGVWHAAARDRRLEPSRAVDFTADADTPTDALHALAEALREQAR